MNETTRETGASTQEAQDAYTEETAPKAPQSEGKDAGRARGEPAATESSAGTDGSRSSPTEAAAEPASSTQRAAEQSTTEHSAISGTEPESGAAVDVPLGMLVGAAEKVGGLVEPFTDRGAAEKRVREYRRQLEDSVRKASTRGAGARHQAQDRIRRLQEADRLKVLTDRAENVQRELTRALDSRSTRAQELIGQVGEQIGSRR